MSLSRQAIDGLRSHWAVNAIGTADLARAERLVNERLAHRAVGGQIAFSFSWSEDHDTCWNGLHSRSRWLRSKGWRN